MDSIKKKKKKIEKAGEVRVFENEIQGEGCKITMPLIRNLLAPGQRVLTQYPALNHWVTPSVMMSSRSVVRREAGSWQSSEVLCKLPLRDLLSDQVSKMQLCRYKDFLSDRNVAACPFLFPFVSRAFWWNWRNCLELRSLKPWIYSCSTGMSTCSCGLSF